MKESMAQSSVFFVAVGELAGKDDIKYSGGSLGDVKKE